MTSVDGRFKESPPRTGLGAAAGAVARPGVPRVILVSCDAGALARDAVALRRVGYRTVAAERVEAWSGFEVEWVAQACGGW